MTSAMELQQAPLRTLGVVLAGGFSSRMGTSKALLNWNPTTSTGTRSSTPHANKSPLRLIDHMIQTVSAGLGMSTSNPQVWVSGQVDGCFCIPDTQPACGPLGGVVSILTHLTPLTRSQGGPLDVDAILVVPVDMPLLTPDLIAQLENAFRALGSNPRAVQFKNQEFPFLLPLLKGATLQVALKRFQGPAHERSLRGLLQDLDSIRLTLPDQAAKNFSNTNTPEEWEKALTEDSSSANSTPSR